MLFFVRRVLRKTFATTNSQCLFQVFWSLLNCHKVAMSNHRQILSFCLELFFFLDKDFIIVCKKEKKMSEIVINRSAKITDL